MNETQPHNHALRRWRAWGLLLASSALLAAHAVAQSALSDWIGKPLDEIRAAAEKGDPIPQRILADAHLSGEGVAKDPAEAAKWLRRAN